MTNIRIADLNISIDNKYEYLERQCTDYLFQGVPDMEISVTEEEMLREGDKSLGMGYLESLAVYRRIAEGLPFYDAILVHGAVFDVEGCGVMLLARSGVGKTTHMANWKRLLGDRMTVVNGDKPIIRRMGDTFYAYGTPWAGKEKLQTNTRTPLKKLCSIQRADDDRCKRLQGDSFKHVIPHVYRPLDDVDALFKTIDLAEELVKSSEYYLIKCTKEPSSAEAAYSVIMKA